MALSQLQRTPGADPQKIAQLQQYGYQLGLAYNAKAIIQRAERDLIKQAESHQPIDADATADRMAVADAVRGASAKHVPEAPPNFGAMTDPEFKEHTRKNYGF